MNPRLPLLALLATASVSFAAPPAPEKGARTPDEILKSVTLPEGYDATVFASPPALGYPISVSAALDGTIFVAVDENGSLGRDPKRGKLLRLRDTNGDGVADEIKVFAEVDSPRGVIWDGASTPGKGALYVMHPPNLTAYYDDDGDGVADRQEDLITGLGFDLTFRGADHTTNACRLAIDGFIYVAVGDYGFVEAKGKDGTVIKHRGGAIVRVRPDGTGLEIVVRGTRNILDVAVSPTLDIFTRDNTNDGGGWNDRLSFNPPGAHMGYPTLFVNFPEDHVAMLADYGGGSPCGSLWLDEPNLPKGLFTVEWGRSAIYRHTLQQKGAGWELIGPDQGQQEWMKLVRPTDIDVDGSERLYITSWEGATFNYNGPNAGYILRLVKKDAPKTEVPDLEKMSPDDLSGQIHSKSATIRQAAQRQLLRKMAAGDAPKAPEWFKYHAGPDAVGGNIAMLSLQVQVARARKESLDSLIAHNEEAQKKAGFIQTALSGGAARVKPGTDGPVTPLDVLQQKTALLLLVDSTPSFNTPVLVKFATAALSDADARTRAAAITALRRLGTVDAAGNILPLVADADPIISHLAVRALMEFKAAQPCLAALDSSDEKVKPGALRALYGIYTPESVDGLIARLGGAQGELRKGILNALCRLDLKDAPYLSPSEWWTTRPDTSGPVFKPEKWEESDKIEATLKREADATKGEDVRWLMQRMYLTKVSFPGLIEQMLAACGNDTPARLTAIEGLFRSDNSLPPEGVKALSEVAANTTETPELRARALRLLQRGSSNGAVFPAALAAFASLAGHEIGQPAITQVFEDFTRDSKNTKWIGDFAKDLAGQEPQRRALAATVLVNLASSSLVKNKDHTAAVGAVEKGWDKPESAAALLGAIARAKSKSFADQVRAHLKDPNNAVAEAALFAYQTLGLNDTGAPAQTIGSLKYEEVAAAVAKGGDIKQGQEMFLRAGCIACHTVSDNEPPKGPNLAAVVKIYDRATLIESILKPNAKIAQGFETQWFKTKKNGDVEGFVTREGGDSLDVRNIVGQTVTLEKGDITERGKRETSMMPEGLLNTFAPAELASLLTYLESLKGK